jgi:hypothetical protein
MTYLEIDEDIDRLVKELDDLHIYDPHLDSISDEDFYKLLEKDLEDFLIDINNNYEVQEEITEAC